MSWLESLPLLCTGVIFLFGILATALPVLPGTAIVLAGIVLHQLWVPEDSVGWNFVLIATAITALVYVFEFLSGWWGAKRFGASWKGALGAFIGGIAGAVFFSLPGLILGPIAGAVLFELLNFRTLPEAGKAGLGTIVGGLLAFALKAAASVGLAGTFFFFLPAG